MAKKKAELEVECHAYLAGMKRVHRLLRQGLYSAAVVEAFDVWGYVDGMMQYARRYCELEEFDSIEAIDVVLKYSPFLFDYDRLDELEKMLKSVRRIEKNTEVSLGDRLVEARGLMKDIHRLWNYLEHHHCTRQDELGKLLGGRQDRWRHIAETLAMMGLLERVGEGRSYTLNLITRMGAVIKGKCPGCGSVQEAPKAMFLESLKCPVCGGEVFFVMLAS